MKASAGSSSTAAEEARRIPTETLAVRPAPAFPETVEVPNRLSAKGRGLGLEEEN